MVTTVSDGQVKSKEGPRRSSRTSNDVWTINPCAFTISVLQQTIDQAGVARLKHRTTDPKRILEQVIAAREVDTSGLITLEMLGSDLRAAAIRIRFGEKKEGDVERGRHRSTSDARTMPSYS